MWLFGYGTVFARCVNAIEIHYQRDNKYYQVFPLPEIDPTEDVQNIKISQKGTKTVVSSESKNFQFENSQIIPRKRRFGGSFSLT